MSKSINDLRDVLFQVLEAVKSGTMDLDKARAINDLSKTIVDTARTEVEYLRTLGGGESAFLGVGESSGTPPVPEGVTSITRHLLGR